MTDKYLEIDENTDVICSLQMTLNALKQTKNSSNWWKWVILSLHSAIQGTIICHLSGTDNLGACDKKDVRKWMVWYDGGSDGVEPTRRLAGPKELFDRLSSPDRRVGNGCAGVIYPSKAQIDAFNLLCELRNDFTHFAPKSWLIEIAVLPKMVLNIVELIEIVTADGWGFRHAGIGQKKELSTLIKEISKLTRCAAI